MPIKEKDRDQHVWETDQQIEETDVVEEKVKKKKAQREEKKINKIINNNVLGVHL